MHDRFAYAELAYPARLCRLRTAGRVVSMRKISSSGFALLLVLWTLVMLSMIALTLAASVNTEVRGNQDAWNQLQADQLATSGHELATYLETRFTGTASEDFTGLPVEAVTPGLLYRVSMKAGTVDLLLEGENGRFNVA